MKNSTHFWDGVFGHGEWGMGHGEEVTNALCPKRRGDYPSTDTWGWSFPPLSMNLLLTK
ncbi:hypothetical protein H6G96_17395 [Nostoc sp. FACHB-892]|uniref:hypothetical protein n=1 Tax=Nostoc sp. FACHB-892 TaxID=2692843 RepID=UPI001685F53A|nr:hypothetical protein [Nostoc sp. FACHB-892]MBD2728044.1 hypothetical protein [Nostoc sp. FACHB-892]